MKALRSNQKTDVNTNDNSFKEETPSSLLMTLSGNEFIEQNKNTYFIKYIKYILEQELLFDDRCTTGFYISKQVYDDWRVFCDSNPKKTYELTEKALLAFMMAVPKNNLLLDITLNTKRRNNNVDDVKDKLICRRLKKSIDRVYSLMERGTLERTNQFDVFIEIMEKAVEVSNPSPELEDLLVQGKDLL